MFNEPAALRSLAFKFSLCIKIVTIVVFVVVMSIAFSQTSAHSVRLQNALGLVYHAVCFFATELSLVPTE